MFYRKGAKCPLLLERAVVLTNTRQKTVLGTQLNQMAQKSEWSLRDRVQSLEIQKGGWKAQGIQGYPVT